MWQKGVGRAWRTVTIGNRSITIGIRREANVWEGRAPLTPTHVSELCARPGVKILVESSNTRVFSDAEYQKAGAERVKSLEACDMIIGIKEVPEEAILPDKTYLCFSHTHKGQPHNMTKLARFLQQRCTLIDYELLVGEQRRRLVAFGRFAGYAGMINCLHSVGLQFLRRAYRTPFLAAKEAISKIGEMLSARHLPRELTPLIFVFTGDGNVSQGAQELFRLLPHRMVDASTLHRLQEISHEDGLVYGCIVSAKDYCQRKDGGGFDQAEYLEHPGRYESIFHRKIAPYSAAIINGIYWENRYPRLLSRQQAMALSSSSSRLVSVADISCDIAGSMEFTDRATTIEEPFFNFGQIQVMSVDNLPAQLAREASSYFGDRLVPLLHSMLSSPSQEAGPLEGATIVHKGVLTTPHQGLTSHIAMCKRKRVLILGSGYVSGPVAKYLMTHSKCDITIASNLLEDASKLAKTVGGETLPVQLDIQQDREHLRSLVADSDLVISLLPATMHLPIAEACIDGGKHLITASYTTPQMEALDAKARAKDVLILNEIGLDPGLDHLSAMRMIDGAREEGAKIVSFKSWCGGLPAPECANNPLGYKFSWSPRGVLLAAMNDARYLREGKEIFIPQDKLLSSTFSPPFDSPLNLEGIANRDSLKYRKLYGLQDTTSMLRGTLRYHGFANLMQQLKEMGYLSLDPLPETFRLASSWLPVTRALVERRGSPLPINVRNAMTWLGLLSDREPFHPMQTMLDSFCILLQSKLRYEPEERDMVIMHHELIIERAGSREMLTSSLFEYGEIGGFSAMARTVGYPVAVAAGILLEGEGTSGMFDNIRGVQVPLGASFYKPMLRRLQESVGIQFKESRATI